jgi:hypothetical protein
MGTYINKDSSGIELSATCKSELLQLDGATVIPKPDKWVENLVCVVNNYNMFEAAAYVDSPGEFEAFNQPDDDRTKTWLIYPNVKQALKK